MSKVVSIWKIANGDEGQENPSGTGNDCIAAFS